MAVTYITGRLCYNYDVDRYGLVSDNQWADYGFHCGEPLEVLVDDVWVKTSMQLVSIVDGIREWGLVDTPYRGNLSNLTARIVV